MLTCAQPLRVCVRIILCCSRVCQLRIAKEIFSTENFANAVIDTKIVTRSTHPRQKSSKITQTPPNIRVTGWGTHHVSFTVKSGFYKHQNDVWSFCKLPIKSEVTSLIVNETFKRHLVGIILIAIGFF